MKQTLKIEFYKLWKYRGIYVSILFSILYAIPEFLYARNLHAQRMEIVNFSGTDGTGYPSTLVTTWIGGDGSSPWSSLYYLILPILCTIPFAASYYAEIRKGYIRNICTRTKKRHYIAAKYITVYVSGGFAAVCPLLVNLWVTSLYVPNLLPSQHALDDAISIRSLWCDIHAIHPLLYIFIYIGLAFLYGGIFAVTAMAVAYVSQNIFFVYLFPFLLNIGAYYYLLTSGYIGWVPVAFLNPMQFGVQSSYSIVFGMYGVLLVLTAAISYTHHRKDVLT